MSAQSTEHSAQSWGADVSSVLCPLSTRSDTWR
jgi:hypothetical protein